MSRIWITSTRPSGEEIAALLTEKGLNAFCAPLLEITASANKNAMPQDGEALAFTSSNGVRAFCALSDRRHWAVYTVGDSTAETARGLGFETVISANGDIESLAELILADQPDAVLHLSGVHVAGDLTGELESGGVSARREIIYGTQPVTELPEQAQQILGQDEPFIIALLSPRAALTLSRLWPKEGVEAEVSFVSLSKNIDAALSKSVLGQRFITEDTSREKLISMLVSVAGRP